MVAAVVQFHLVAGFQQEANTGGVDLNTAAGVEHAIGAAVSDRADLVREGTAGDRPRHAKIEQPALEHDKNPHRTFGCLDLRAKQAVDQTEVGPERVGDPAAGNGVGGAALEVIGHLAFDGYGRVNV